VPISKELIVKNRLVERFSGEIPAEESNYKE